MSNSLRYPLYIISKGRWERRATSKALEKINVPYHIVIEPQEFDQYAAAIDESKILVLPFSNLGQGSIPARNWVWEHAIERDAERHWILDDNIREFYYLNRNYHNHISTGFTFRAIEDFVDRYTNVAMAGMQYITFAIQRDKASPIRLNTRVYSCILIQNRVSHRWRGRYNEDTDLSLRCLKSGWCTILFNAFTMDKATTMTSKGGNTDELYRQDECFDGRLEMAKSLQRQHPDVTKIVWKWGRWQHQVDYRPFKNNRLRKKPGVEIPQGVNNYGMKLVKLDE
jgi:hypothetical protein